MNKVSLKEASDKKMYNPPIKNLREFIRDIKDVNDEKMTLDDFIKKIDELNFKDDPTDGFEDILDILRPAFRRFLKSTGDGESS